MAQKELIATKNFATNKKVAERAKQHVNKIFQESVEYRSSLDDRYMQFFNIWNTIFDIQYYQGRSQVYSPQLRKNVEFAVRNLRRNLFPTDDYFSIESEADDFQVSEKLKRFFKWQHDNKIRLKRYVTPFLRQMCIYGWSPLKIIWNEESKNIFTHQRVKKPIFDSQVNSLTGELDPVQTGEETIIEQTEETVRVQHQPTFLPVDIFSFYIYPVTVWDVSDAYACMEALTLNEYHLKKEEENGIYVNVKDLISRQSNTQNTTDRWTKKRRIQQLGYNVQESGSDAVAEWNIVEYWGKFDLNDNGKEIDCVITVGEEDIVLQVRQNPYYDQEPPYIVGKLDEAVGEFYGHGLIEPLQTLQYLLNDQKNQINDGISYALTPIVKYDPGIVVNFESIKFAPGAMWALSDVNGVSFDRPPDVAQSGWQGVQLLQAEIDEFPGFEKVPTTGRRPATQVSAIQQDRGISILDWSENIETQVMNPFLKKQFMLNQQFLDEDIPFRVIGGPIERMSPEELVGNYQFRWLGANQTQNQVVRSQQMVNFLQIMSGIPPSGTEQPNFWYVAKRIWKDGFGLDGEHLLTRKLDYSKALDPSQENFILVFGKNLPVNEVDNDQQHMQMHQQVLQNPQISEFGKSIVKQHMQQHMNKLGMLQQTQNASQQEQVPEDVPSPEQQVSPGSPTGGE